MRPRCAEATCVRRLFAAALAAAAFGAPANRAIAQGEPSPSPSPQASLSASAACTAVDQSAASDVLGYPVAPAERSSRVQGICFFPSLAVSQEGSVAYAVVTADSLSHLRPYFRLLARRCGNVSHGASNAPLCATFAKLARATDLTEYFAARTEVDDAIALPQLGARAVAANGTVYVAAGTRVFEAIVRRDGAFDLARSTALGRRLLESMAP